MIDLMEILSMLVMLVPFVILSCSNARANLKRPVRYKQFLMPAAALIYCIIVMCVLGRFYEFSMWFLESLPHWAAALAALLQRNLSGGAFSFLADWALAFAQWLEDFIRSIDLEFWAFYLSNAFILLLYVTVKRIVLLFMRGLFRDGNLFHTLAGLFYEYDEDTGYWNLQSKFCQARTFLKTLYIAAVALGALGVVISSYLYMDELLTAIYYPVFSVIILGELYFALCGLTKKELRHDLTGETEEAEHVSNYSIMCGVLRKLFPDKLNAENTTVSDPVSNAQTNEELLDKLEESGTVAEEAYGRFMRAKANAGMELDFNYLLSGRQLLNGESVLFNNPFYYDLIPYAFYPMNRKILRHKKVLVVLGRHGAEADVEKWCRDGLTAVTNIPSMWNIGVLSSEKQDLDVGIITRSSVHDLPMHEANRDFFDEVEFVVLVEPSRLLPTAQVGLNSLVRHCRRKKKKIVFCSVDKNCDGLLDALSHTLMTSLREVSATNHHKGASSYMIWEADGEHLQHRMLPNLSRYLGMGTELSFAALKNQIPQTQWFGGDSFPVVDIHWITRQYYYDLLHYANLPATQEMVDRVFRVSADMWSAPTAANQYITVEDESYNMFEVKRAFSTRATDQGFINVICSDYLLKDYMADNDSIFNADPKAIPYITADYARTPRNVVLRLCLRMSIEPVAEREVLRELTIIDRCEGQPAETLWREICAVCGYVGSADVDEFGRQVLRCRTGGEDAVFTSDVLVLKRRFSLETGKLENMYSITNRRFIQLVLGDLRSAEYVAEDENGQRQYLGTELQGQVVQKYLPGQFFTFGGKYYEMLRITRDGQVLVRRASDHIDGRPSYRQVREYSLTEPVDSTVMGECRDMGAFRITRQYTNIRVKTPAYWRMKRYNDFGTATRVGINGVPERTYNNKAILRIDLDPEGKLPEGTVQTLSLLMNEVLRTLLAENQDFLAAVTAGEAKLPNTYSLFGENGWQPSSGSIYLIEDSQMDIGLLDAVERNLNRIFAIIWDYLQWNEEAMNAPEPTPEPEKEPEQEPVVVAPAKKLGFFARIWRAICNFFKAIGRFFKKIFKKLFGGKKTAEPAEPQTEAPEGQDQPVAEGTEAQPVAEGTEAQPVAEDNGAESAAEQIEAEPAAEAAEAQTEEPAEANFSLFSATGTLEDAADTAEDGDDADGPVEVAPGADGDTMEFEPEKVVTPGVGFRRLPYKERYYLRYGSQEIADGLQLNAVRDLLTGLGYGNNALTQARRGKNVAEMVERSFVPNRSGVHYCDFCGCELTGMDYDILGDGRERCPTCGRTAVRDLDEFVKLHDAVLRNMKLFFGVKINAPVRVQMVNSRKLHKKLGKTFIPTGKFDGRVLGVAIKDRDGYSILVENGAPKLQSTMTMVHEMTHIWQYLNWDMKAIKKNYGALELEVYEGMAKWVEIQYAYLLGETATGKREELITRHRDDPYGRGFLKYADKYPLTYGPRNGQTTPFDNPKKPL